MPILSWTKRYWAKVKYSKDIIIGMGPDAWRTISAQYGETLGKALTRVALLLTAVAGFFAFMGRDTLQLIFSNSAQGEAVFATLSSMYLALARDLGLAAGATGFIGHWLRRNGIHSKAQEEKMMMEDDSSLNLAIVNHKHKQQINQLKASLPRAPGTSLKKTGRKKRRK